MSDINYDIASNPARPGETVSISFDGSAVDNGGNCIVISSPDDGGAGGTWVDTSDFTISDLAGGSCDNSSLMYTTPLVEGNIDFSFTNDAGAGFAGPQLAVVALTSLCSVQFIGGQSVRQGESITVRFIESDVFGGGNEWTVHLELDGVSGSASYFTPNDFIITEEGGSNPMVDVAFTPPFSLPADQYTISATSSISAGGYKLDFEYDPDASVFVALGQNVQPQAFGLFA